MQGDELALSALYERHHPAVYSLQCRMLCDRVEAEDAAQQTFAKAFAALESYDARRPFRTWLLGIARNQAVDIIRRRQAKPVFLQPPEVLARQRESESALIGEPSAPDRLVTLLRPLSDLQRQVLFLRHALDFSPAEVGAIIGRSPARIREIEYRAARTLRPRVAHAVRSDAGPAARAPWR